MEQEQSHKQELAVLDREMQEIANSQPQGPPRPSLQAHDRGVLVGSTLEEQYRLAQYYTKSGLMPQGLNTPEKVLVALQLCHELGLPPMSSIGKIAVINQTPSLFGDLPLALVMRSGLLEDIEETLELDAQGKDPLLAICKVKRRGMDTPIERCFSQEDAKRAGIWGKRVWLPYPKRMMQMRARSHALKDAFADVLSGVQISEYDADMIVEDNSQPLNNRRSSLNEKFAPDPATKLLTGNQDHDKKNE